MHNIIPVYRKQIDLETGLPILDENGQEISEHVRDIIIPDPIDNVYSEFSEEELKEIELSKIAIQKLQLEVEKLLKNP